MGILLLEWRLIEEEYQDRKLGLHPSSILTSQDLNANPELLVLLLGEVDPFFYYHGNIIINSEEKYLEAYEQKPFPTDLKYFLIALGNIVLNRARSA